jgi:hypothetical protein
VGDSVEHDGEWYRVCAVEDRGHDDHDEASEELSGFVQAVTLISVVAPRHVGTPVAPG